MGYKCVSWYERLRIVIMNRADLSDYSDIYLKSCILMDNLTKVMISESV